MTPAICSSTATIPAATSRLPRLAEGRQQFQTHQRVPEHLVLPAVFGFDGKYLAVGDAIGSVVYQFQISGQTATVVGTTPLGRRRRHVRLLLSRLGAATVSIAARSSDQRRSRRRHGMALPRPAAHRQDAVGLRFPSRSRAQPVAERHRRPIITARRLLASHVTSALVPARPNARAHLWLAKRVA